MDVRRKVDAFEYLIETERLLRGDGLFLVSAGGDGKANTMTIGWGLIGTIWRKPFFLVAVRPSRFTHHLIEESGEFTVCLPARGMEQALEFCGTRSGRDVDKFRALNLTPVKGFEVDAPYIAECPVHYECRVAYKTDLRPEALEEELRRECYPAGDYHTLYFGLILGVYAEEDARDKLP